MKNQMFSEENMIGGVPAREIAVRHVPRTLKKEIDVVLEYRGPGVLPRQGGEVSDI